MCIDINLCSGRSLSPWKKRWRMGMKGPRVEQTVPKEAQPRETRQRKFVLIIRFDFVEDI